MCGIGIAITPGSLEHQNIVENINNLQLHRGPDNNSIINFKGFSLCHQRLSIIDLNKRSNQPYKFKNITLIFNGEIYNFQSLRNELISIGFSFNTNSDTEVLAVGIYHFGKDFLKRIDGMFALVWFDSLTNKIFLNSDPFGVKKIYFYNQNNTFFASSELFITKLIANKFGYKLNLESRKLIDFCKHLSIPFSETPFKEINSVSNGNLIIISLNKFTKEFTFNEEKGFVSKLINFKNNLSRISILDKVIDESLYADVPQGLLISGGLDSTNIALSCRNKNSIFKGYCINTNLVSDGFSNDLDFARIVSAKESIPLNIINKEKSISVETIEETLKSVSNIGEFSSAISLNMIVKKVGADSIRVIQSGLGADEIYGGYTIMKNFNRLKLLSNLIKLSKLNKVVFLKILKIYPLVQNVFSTNRVKIINSLLNENYENLISTLISWDFEIKSKTNNHTKINIENYRDLIDFYFDYFLSSSHLPISDSVSMAESIELRLPFLSRRLYSSVYPMLYERCDKKQILRKRLSEFYEKSFILRNKAGFGISPNNLEQPVIHYLIDNLYDSFIKEVYDISKDDLYKNLSSGIYARFPYVLLSLLTYKKIIE